MAKLFASRNKTIERVRQKSISRYQRFGFHFGDDMHHLRCKVNFPLIIAAYTLKPSGKNTKT
jgi:hypothetical protein